MEKAIKLIMCKEKSIKIFVNDEEKCIIDMQSRSINAEKIYEIIGFTAGDHYSVLSENVTDVDNQVLEFFTELFDDIVEKVNAIDVSDKGSNDVMNE